MWGMQCLVLMFVTLLGFGCERIETVETVYPNLEAAAKAGAIGDEKWIPAFLPSSATSIREVHNLDTNEEWLVFRFNTVDLATLESACKPIAGTASVLPRKAPGTWWPQELTKHAKGREQQQGPYNYYSCKGQSGMVITRERTEAYYWTWIE